MSQKEKKKKRKWSMVRTETLRNIERNRVGPSLVQCFEPPLGGGLERASVKRQAPAGCYDLEDVDDTCKAAIVRPDPFCVAGPWRSCDPRARDPILQIPR